MNSASTDQSVASAIGASVPVGLVGSFPGSDVWEATAIVRGELPFLPLLPELPERGPGADMIGRTMSLLARVSSEFAVITTPSGWRLAGQHTAHLPAAMRRAASWLSEDLDAAQSSFAEFTGAYKVQLTGPWTLAACVELSGGDRLLRDRGAVAELHAALAEAAASHVREVSRRLPGVDVLVQFDEPMLDAVLTGAITTPSGFRAYEPVRAAHASHTLAGLVDRCHGSGALAGVHTCANRPDIALLAAAGFDFLSIDLDRISRGTRQEVNELENEIGNLWDTGRSLFAGLAAPTAARAERGSSSTPIDELLHRLGIPIAEIDRQLVVTPSCGLVGAGSLANVRDVISELQAVGRKLRDERLEGQGEDE